MTDCFFQSLTNKTNKASPRIRCKSPAVRADGRSHSDVASKGLASRSVAPPGASGLSSETRGFPNLEVGWAGPEVSRDWSASSVCAELLNPSHTHSNVNASNGMHVTVLSCTHRNNSLALAYEDRKFFLDSFLLWLQHPGVSTVLPANKSFFSTPPHTRLSQQQQQD